MAVTRTTRIYHDALDVYSEVPTDSLEAWEGVGWVAAEQEAPAGADVLELDPSAELKRDPAIQDNERSQIPVAEAQDRIKKEIK